MSPHRPTARSLPVVLLLCVAACGPDTVTADLTVRRDSAGVQVVENSAPAWDGDPAWTVDTTPLFGVTPDTSAPGSYEFQRLLHVYRLAGGTVVVLDQGEPFVRAFDADGKQLWSAVRRGDGPGEMREPALLSRIRGDSLVVDDGRSPGSLLLAPSGDIVGTLPSRLVPAPDGAPGERMLYPALRLRDGSLLAYAPIMRRAELEGDGMVVPRWPAYLLPRSGGDVSTLGEWPFVTTAQLSAPSVHVLFGARAALAPVGDGFLHGWPATPELRRYDASGTVREIVRTPGGRRVATPDEIAAARREITAVMANPRQAAQHADELLVDSIPAYGRVVVGTDGVTWRERFDPGAPPATSGLARLDRGAAWDVLDTQGRWLGGVRMPVAFYLTDAGPDWVAGIHSDPGDAQTPLVYPLVRQR